MYRLTQHIICLPDVRRMYACTISKHITCLPYVRTICVHIMCTVCVPYVFTVSVYLIRRHVYLMCVPYLGQVNMIHLDVQTERKPRMASDDAESWCR